MKDIHKLLQNNRDWGRPDREGRPEFFHQLAKQQHPDTCGSAAPIRACRPTRSSAWPRAKCSCTANVANVVAHTDLNCLSVVQYAVDQLKVKHILIVGHYGCGGVHACLHNTRVGLADNWLRHVGDVMQKHTGILDAIETDELKHARLCETERDRAGGQLCRSTIVQDAWARGQKLMVHGWVYSLKDGSACARWASTSVRRKSCSLHMKRPCPTSRARASATDPLRMTIMLASPINLHAWIEEEPPPAEAAGGQQDDRQRRFHRDGGRRAEFAHRLSLRRRPEWFYQLEGEMVLKVQEDGAVRDIPIRAGEIFCCRQRFRTRRGARPVGSAWWSSASACRTRWTA